MIAGPTYASNPIDSHRAQIARYLSRITACIGRDLDLRRQPQSLRRTPPRFGSRLLSEFESE
jgi:hypothetical protein